MRHRKIKFCPGCHLILPYSAYGKDKGRIRARCRRCHSIEENRRYHQNSFPARRRSSLGWQQIKSNVSEHAKYLKRKKHERFIKKDKLADARLRLRYGLTLEQYEELLKKQGGVCAICGSPPKTKRLNVDHNHKTGERRGLLCFNCNRTLIGHHNDPEIFKRAAAYLAQYEKPEN